MTELATARQMLGQLGEAISLESEALRLKRQHFPRASKLLLASLDNLATCYERSQRQAEAEVLRREIAAIETGLKAGDQEVDLPEELEP